MLWARASAFRCDGPMAPAHLSDRYWRIGIGIEVSPSRDLPHNQAPLPLFSSARTNDRGRPPRKVSSALKKSVGEPVLKNCGPGHTRRQSGWIGAASLERRRLLYGVPEPLKKLRSAQLPGSESRYSVPGISRQPGCGFVRSGRRTLTSASRRPTWRSDMNDLIHRPEKSTPRERGLDVQTASPSDFGGARHLFHPCDRDFSVDRSMMPAATRQNQSGRVGIRARKPGSPIARGYA